MHDTKMLVKKKKKKRVVFEMSITLSFAKIALSAQ